MLAAMGQTLSATSVPFGYDTVTSRTKGHVVASRSPGRRP